MKRYTFAPYTRDAPLSEQRSNIVFVMLRQAVMGTPMKAEKSSDRAEWRRMGKIIDALEALEMKEGEGVKETIRLVEFGGELILEDAENELLWRLVDHWLESVPLGAARQVNWLMEFKESTT